jgi:MoxR-like ATPase
MGRQHKCFDTLLSLVSAGMNVWMAGPAGSGKTTAAQNVAKALGLKFYFTGAVRDEFNLLGFTDAQGRTVRKPFREAWEHGGLFLWDEIDGSDPSALVAFNAALANGVCDFPDGMVPRHKNCVILAAANTWGNSATSEYIGRNKQDAASLDRFAMLHWPYDEELETATCGNPAWAKKVQTMRQRANAQGIKQVISPRASYMGAALLASGMDEGAVINIVIRKGMTDAQWANVKL